jgi:serine/threonine protein kinase
MEEFFSLLNEDVLVKFLLLFARVVSFVAFMPVFGHTAISVTVRIIREEGALGESQVLSLAKQMVAILSYLENLNPKVVHRDFTPDNLILQPDGRLKLIDFSISHLYQAGGSADCAGKHSYTPPEQYRGEATPQSDIYAFGATLAFLLTGKDPQPIATSHPKVTVPEISQQMDNLVSRATAIALVERYESCKWIELDLEDSASVGHTD